MVEVVKSATFDRWLRKLRDRRAAARVLVRIDRLVAGNPGDVRLMGAGISELRIDYAPGIPGLLPARRATSGPAADRRGQVDPGRRHQDRARDRPNLA